jgi:hypothetical protein
VLRGRGAKAHVSFRIFQRSCWRKLTHVHDLDRRVLAELHIYTLPCLRHWVDYGPEHEIPTSCVSGIASHPRRNRVQQRDIHRVQLPPAVRVMLDGCIRHEAGHDSSTRSFCSPRADCRLLPVLILPMVALWYPLPKRHGGDSSSVYCIHEYKALGHVYFLTSQLTNYLEDVRRSRAP